MPTKTILPTSWYHDDTSLANGEPGIQHSFVSSLASCIRSVSGRIDPIWLMGSSAFAFRIFANEVMCPSAMSVFHWSAILPEAIEQIGYHCTYIERMWGETDKEKEKREEAQGAIIEAIGRGIPSVVWDIARAEWGLIIGFDEEERVFHTLTCQGKPARLPFERLGKNGIDILSVVIPKEKNSRSRAEIVERSLNAAVAHAEQKEWMDRPTYQDGLSAYDLWAVLLERWAMLLEAGKEGKVNPDIRAFAGYYANHHYAARCYARDYLKSISEGDPLLEKASICYQKVAACLRPVWTYFSSRQPPEKAPLLDLAGEIRSAKSSEEEGIGFIKEALGH